MTTPAKPAKATAPKTTPVVTTKSQDTAEVDRRNEDSRNVRDDMELVVLDEDTRAGLDNAIRNSSVENE